MREELTASMRSRIRETFARMIQEKQDTADVTMESLAAEMGVAKGTLYLYYKNKAEIVKDTLRQEREIMLEQMNRLFQPELTPDGQLRGYAKIMLEEFTRNRGMRLEFIRNVPFEVHRDAPDRNMEVLTRILEQGIASGFFREVDVPGTAMFIRCSIIGQFRYLLRTGKPLNAEALSSVFEDMVIRSLLRK